MFPRRRQSADSGAEDDVLPGQVPHYSRHSPWRIRRPWRAGRTAALHFARWICSLLWTNLTSLTLLNGLRLRPVCLLAIYPAALAGFRWRLAPARVRPGAMAFPGDAPRPKRTFAGIFVVEEGVSETGGEKLPVLQFGSK